MIPFLVTAALGAGFIWACVRYARFMRRLVLSACAATAGLFLWLALGRHNLYVAYAPFALAPVGAWAWWRNRAQRRAKTQIRRAFKDEKDDAGNPRIPVVTRYERIEDDA